jgi:phage repressor protein C with HTH and peptisase S24 domain
MGNFGTRLEEFRVYKKYRSQELFAETMGLSQKNITSWVAGNMPTSKNLQKITSRFPEVNQDWLLSGMGEMLNKQQGITLHENQEHYSKSDTKTKVVTLGSQPDATKLAVLTMNSLARIKTKKELEAFISQKELPEGFAIIPEFDHCNAYLEMDTDEMAPTIEINEKMVCRLKTNINHISPGRMYLINVDGDLTVRRIYLTDNPNILRLEADNPFYPAYEIQKDSIEYMFTIHGQLRRPTSRRIAA